MHIINLLLQLLKKLEDQSADKIKKDELSIRSSPKPICELRFICRFCQLLLKKNYQVSQPKAADLPLLCFWYIEQDLNLHASLCQLELTMCLPIPPSMLMVKQSRRLSKERREREKLRLCYKPALYRSSVVKVRVLETLFVVGAGGSQTPTTLSIKLHNHL